MSRLVHPARRRAARPACESLEARELLSAAPLLHHVVRGMAAQISVARNRNNANPGLSLPFLARIPATPDAVVSTIPANGDLNPYGIAILPNGYLVSNFNNSQNQQGTGTTIVRISRTGVPSLFYQGPPGVGLTTALGVLSKGYVIVGSLPTTDGTSDTVQQGSLLILNRSGGLVANLTNSVLLDGPWDLTINDQGSHAQVFVSNVLNGTVTRLDLNVGNNRVTVARAVTIAAGYSFRTDPAALVVGPTGLAYDARRDILYVASTADNAIFAIPGAGRSAGGSGPGVVVYQDDVHLHGPLGLTLLPYAGISSRRRIEQ